MFDNELNKICNELNEIVIHFFDKYIGLDEKITAVKLSDEKWSLKEIIGHLVDSASNNHQRFVRLQISNLNDFPSYHYSWIDIENYNLMKFSDIMLLWKQFNILLCHIIKNIDENKLDNYWSVDNKQITLKAIITDYLRHLKDHIKHFEERYTELK